MKFKKRPVVIEAEAFFPRAFWPDGVRPGDPSKPLHLQEFGLVDTSHGEARIDPGDYVMTGVDGEKYPCRRDIFEATYEPAEAGDR